MSTEIRLDRRRLGALTAALVLLLSACVTARAEGADGPDFITMIMAEDAVRQYDLRDAEGNPLTPRAAPEMKGRGNPDVPGQEPDRVHGAAVQLGHEPLQHLCQFTVGAARV